MNYQQGAGPWAHTISVVVWGGAGNLCGVNQGAAPTITTVKHSILNAVPALPYL